MNNVRSFYAFLKYTENAGFVERDIYDEIVCDGMVLKGILLDLLRLIFG